jgi:hypothetical protein
MTPVQQSRVEQAITKLKSFGEGDAGVLDAIACGQDAVPALRAILFERERSGLYQARCRAVGALAALHAYDALIEFLRAERTISDPVERLGEDAVINAAALALANIREQQMFELLLMLARRPALTGVIGALGAFARAEAIPALIDALGEDASRHTAEAALRKLGPAARAALVNVATARTPSGMRESASSARRRRAALGLLAEIGLRRSDWASVRPLMHDSDAKVAALVCQTGLDQARPSDRREAARSLIALLANGDWLLREQIEGCLADHFDGAVRETVEAYLSGPRAAGAPLRSQIDEILRRVIARAGSAPSAQ